MSHQNIHFGLYCIYGLILSFWLAVLYQKTASVFCCAIFHGFSNLMLSMFVIKANWILAAGLIAALVSSIWLFYQNANLQDYHQVITMRTSSSPHSKRGVRMETQLCFSHWKEGHVGRNADGSIAKGRYSAATFCASLWCRSCHAGQWCRSGSGFMSRRRAKRRQKKLLEELFPENQK